jgi:hypothetical protein
LKAFYCMGMNYLEKFHLKLETWSSLVSLFATHFL